MRATHTPPLMTCRHALKSAGTACLALLAAATGTPTHALPKFSHVILIIQENRTPDNLFGSNPQFEPGVDIATEGINSLGQAVPLGPVPLANCYDISHTHIAFGLALANSADQEPVYHEKKGCVFPANPQFKYVDNSAGAVQPYFDLAKQYGFANRMFQTNQGPSFPAHQFLFAGTSSPTADTPLFAAENMNLLGRAGCTAPPNQTVNLVDAQGSETSNAPIYPCLEHPSLADAMSAANPPLGWRYYAGVSNSIWNAPTAINHICQPQAQSQGQREGQSQSQGQGQGQGSALKCTGPAWIANDISGNPAQVLTDIAGCKLQAVTWITPTIQESDHPGINDGSGPSWVAQLVNAIGQQSCAGGERYWNDTAILVLWDDWGGWYDHVKPFNSATAGWGAGYTYGFRVPLIVVSAYTKAGAVSSRIYDFGSLLYFTERNFGLDFIGSELGANTEYADYYAAPRGPLADFFTLTTPRPFVTISAPMSRAFFVHDHRPQLPDRD